MSEDRSPIADSGELEVSKGIAAIFRSGRQDLPAMPQGHRRVLIDGNGEVIGDEVGLSAGERQRRQVRRWVMVDMREHPMTFTVPFAGPGSTASFAAKIGVLVSVVDHVAVVNKGIESISLHLQPALERAVKRAAGQSDPSTIETAMVETGTAIHRLVNARETMDRQLQTLGDEQLEEFVPEWLAVKVQSCVVDFDDATRKHYDDLVGGTRDGQVIKVGTENDQLREEGRIATRTLWRDALAGAIDDPVSGLLDVAASDPSPENLAKVTSTLLQLQSEKDAHGREVMLELLRKDFLDESHPLFEVLTNTLQKSVPGMLRGGASQLGDSTSRQSQISQTGAAKSAGGGEGTDESDAAEATVEFAEATAEPIESDDAAAGTTSARPEWSEN